MKRGHGKDGKDGKEQELYKKDRVYLYHQGYHWFGFLHVRNFVYSTATSDVCIVYNCMGCIFLGALALNSVWGLSRHKRALLTPSHYSGLPEFWPYVVSQDVLGMLSAASGSSGEASTASAVLCVSCACGIVMQVIYVRMCICVHAMPWDGMQCCETFRYVHRCAYPCTCVDVCYDCL